MLIKLMCNDPVHYRTVIVLFYLFLLYFCTVDANLGTLTKRTALLFSDNMMFKLSQSFIPQFYLDSTILNCAVVSKTLSLHICFSTLKFALVYFKVSMF